MDARLLYRYDNKMDAIFSFKFTHLAEAQRRRAQVRNGERGSAAAAVLSLLRSATIASFIANCRRGRTARERMRERYVMRLPTLFIPFCGRNSAHWRVAFKASSMVGPVS